MSKAAVEHLFTGATGDISVYDKTKTMLGSLFRQNTGPLDSDKWVGPAPIALARPMEQSTAIPSGLVHAISWSSNVDWLFLGDLATAASTRRINMFTYNRVTGTLAWQGFVTMNFVTNTGNKTIRGLRAFLTRHTSGTVGVSGGVNVAGDGSTTFLSDGIAAGARIGFGTQDPTQVTTWYDIASITSNSVLTLGQGSPDVTAGTQYVIEELRVAVSLTNATPANGGLFLIKGLNQSVFQTIGTNIAEAAAADNIRAIYWLADAATVTDTVSAGLADDDFFSLSTHYVYTIDGSTTAKIYKYNVRAVLTGLASGKSTSAFVLVTNASGTLTGTLAAVGNGRVCTLNHGVASGVKSLFFVTGTRVYRAAITGITSGNPNFISDNMVEIPPGSVNTYAASGALSQVDYSPMLDRLVVMTTGASGNRSYVTQYNTASLAFDHVILAETRQLDQSTADSRVTPIPGIDASPLFVWTLNGIFYLVRNSSTAALNQLYAVPMGVDWTYSAATMQRVITPEIQTPNATKFYRAVVTESEYLGSDFAVITTEPVRLSVRTSGINDNSGSWTVVDRSGIISGIAASSSVQFMLEFRMLGFQCLPARVYAVTAVYEDSSTDSHFQPSVKWSDASTKKFAWRLSSAFGGTVPTLRIRLYDAVSGSGPLVDDTTVVNAGTWEKSTDDGATWGNCTTADKANEITYVRYTPAALADNIKVRALLTQN